MASPTLAVLNYLNFMCVLGRGRGYTPSMQVRSIGFEKGGYQMKILRGHTPFRKTTPILCIL
jgi:hypothetical protein